MNDSVKIPKTISLSFVQFAIAVVLFVFAAGGIWTTLAGDVRNHEGRLDTVEETVDEHGDELVNNRVDDAVRDERFVTITKQLADIKKLITEQK